VRVIGPEGENLGVFSRDEAIKRAEETGLDLIEISSHTDPPVAKIADYGKFLYEQKKKKSAHKARSHSVEVKNLQVKINTGQHDLELKAKKASEWLSEGHRVKFDLFLPGRAKYLNEDFLAGRLERVLALLSVDYKIADELKKSPKGRTIIIEKA
jgi:translation initiation factor IF-3